PQETGLWRRGGGGGGGGMGWGRGKKREITSHSCSADVQGNQIRTLSSSPLSASPPLLSFSLFLSVCLCLSIFSLSVSLSVSLSLSLSVSLFQFFSTHLFYP